MNSCGKDDPKPKTKTDIITAVTWKITKLKVDTDEGTPEACFADNEYTFQADGDYKELENTKCDPSDPSSTSGTWAFKTNETILTISYTDPDSGFTLSIDKQILELTDTSLKVKYTFFGTTIEETYSPK